MLKVSLAQINPKSGDIRGNASKIILGIERAREEKCDLVVFPEMCLPGYCLDEKLLINLRFLRENKRVLMEEIRPACREVAAVVGFIDFDESRKGPDSRVARQNAAAVMQDGELLQVVHKKLLPGYRYFEDKRYFQPGREVETVLIRTRNQEMRLGILICEDLWDEDYEFKPSAILREKGAQLLVSINASPFVASTPGEEDGKRFRRHRLITSQIRRHGVPVVYVNTVGIGDNGKNIIPYDGRSLAYGASGETLAVLSQFREEQRTVCIGDDGTPLPEAPYDREEEIFQALVMSVRDYYDKLGIFKCVLEAVSGGIDSSLGTAIAYAAMGPELLSLYNLPSKHNSPKTQELAKRLAGNFGLTYQVIPIQDMVDQVVRDFERYLRPIRLTVTVENLQSRIRGLIMMAESNDREALLLTNGNETEIALGYATLYGDMVGGLSIIGDITKPDVYRLARYVNRKWEREMIPEEVFSIPASAELKPDQVDPFDYPVVGPVVNDIVEMGLSPEELLERFTSHSLPEKRYPIGDGSVYERYTTEQFRQLTRDLYRVINQSVYKRLQGAPIVVVSDRAFGFDLRETIINGWDGG
jgi:NAD+ synthase (glutamine-hydrolysing)